MKSRGLPINIEYVDELAANWQALRMHYIRRDDHFGLYDGNGSFHEDRLEALVTARGWALATDQDGQARTARQDLWQNG